MILATPLLSIIKYSFLGLVVTGAGFLIANTAVFMHYKAEEMERLAYRAQTFPRDESVSLNRNSLYCLLQPSKPFCLMPSKKRLKLLKNRRLSPISEDTFSGDVSSTLPTKPFHPLYGLMKDFVDFANTSGVKPILLEPSILFCMLSTLQKYSLISSNLKTKTFQGLPNSVTFCVSDFDSRILINESSMARSSEIGFEFSRTMSLKDLNGMDTSFSVHRENLTVTVIVFFQRDTFMWYPGQEERKSRPSQFEISQVYENFTGVPYQFEDGGRSGFYLPSEVNHFLLQVQRSNFEECLPTTSEEGASHPVLSPAQLSHRALIAVQELKLLVRPWHGTLLLWNETLSGWNETCNLFQRTSELEIAVTIPVSVVPKIDLNQTLTDNDYLHVVEYHTWDDLILHVILDCYGLRIRITVMYEDHDSMWTYDTAGDILRKNYWNLRVCSTSVLGQLVHKPCTDQAS